MTNRELAHQLNISPAALSLIVNHKPGVSDATRKKIIKQLNELGYSHLIKKEPPPNITENNLCFVIYKRHGKILNQHPFFLLMTESIESRAREFGYRILLTTIDKKGPVDKQIESLNQMNAKGFIIFATEMLDDDIAYFNNLNRPYVAIDNDFTHLDINTISINNGMGTFQAIEHLYQMGHRNIGYLQSNVYISSFGERARGYEDAMAHFNLKLSPDFTFKVQYTEEGSYQDFKHHLNGSANLPTAFVTDDDTIATGVMRALFEKGIRIPEDISIVGFNDRPNCELSSPKLTSVNVPRHSFGAEAVDSILSLIEKGENGKPQGRSIKIRIGTQLIKRESVRKLN